MDQKVSDTKYITHEKVEKRRRRCCCCCRTRRSKITCAIITVLILIGLAIALYFCIPRGMPAIQFNGVETGSNLDITKLILNASSGIVIPLSLKLSVNNPNLIGIKMDNITAKGFYEIGNGQSVQVGEGSLTQKINFPAKGKVDFLLPITLTYNPKTDKSSAAALAGLLGHCGITAAQKSPIPLKYKAVLDIAQISWLGIKPEIENNVSFDCPITAPPGVSSTIGSILGDIMGN
ncbi:hypothetical protein K7432_005120 [Basidiobolus ranarum]|uniref:Late embryogenesis abundant protein LEA-2 subgroup domain-containing protein n=1 Tax=Basidiobolus ranarum TaxID=34480 RepID=A0ABR2WX30_9FUNG